VKFAEGPWACPFWHLGEQNVLGKPKQISRCTFPIELSFCSPVPLTPCKVNRLSFSVNLRQSENVSLVDVQGRLTSFEARAFRDAIHGLLDQGHSNIILNLTGLQYLDSSGIGELVRNYLSVIKKGGAMKVVGLAPKVEEILKVTQLYQVFPEFPDEASALESFPGETKKRAEK